MNINTKDFEALRQEIVDCFNLSNEIENFLLTPDGLNEVFEKSRRAISWVAIPNWERFESCDCDISYEDFMNLMFKEHYKTKGSIYIITDNCHIDKKAYYIDCFDLEGFIKVEYYKSHQTCFIQPEDIIFFNLMKRFFQYYIIQDLLDLP